MLKLMLISIIRTITVNNDVSVNLINVNSNDKTENSEQVGGMKVCITCSMIWSTT